MQFSKKSHAIRRALVMGIALAASLMIGVGRGSAAPADKAAASDKETTLQWQPLYEPGSGGAMVDIAVSPFDSKRVLVAGDMLGVGL